MANYMLAGWCLPITGTELQPCNYSPLDLTGRPNTQGLLMHTHGVAEAIRNAIGIMPQGSNKVTTGSRRPVAVYFTVNCDINCILTLEKWQKMPFENATATMSHPLMAANFRTTDRSIETTI